MDRFKKRVGVLCLLGLSHAMLLPVLGGDSAPIDPICGNAGLRYYSEALDVKSGPCVDLLTRDARAGESVELKFFVSEKRSGQPLENLQTQHERQMHVIGVREDLKGFFHIHPVEVGPGVWSVSHTFVSGGKYKIWSDIAYSGAAFTLGQPLLTVSGDRSAAVTPAIQTNVCRVATVSGFEILLSHTEPLFAGTPNLYTFTVRSSIGESVSTEDFVGAPMHVFAIREDLTGYHHAHSEDKSSSTTGLRFRQVLEEPGRYKLFVQFRPSGSGLSQDEALLAEFYVDVVPARLASASIQR
jgi:hypothetical protein